MKVIFLDQTVPGDLPRWPRWLLFFASASDRYSLEAKLACGPSTTKSNALPRTVAIAANPAGTGAHALASGLAAVASKVTPVSAQSAAL